MKLRILAGLYEDLSQGADWYDAQGPSLGVNFESAVYDSIGKISLRPLACPKVYLDFRRRLLRRYPYAIYYRITDQEIIVTLVLHLARNPELLRRLCADESA